VIAAMVLAAGMGTRLRPLTDLCAKPLVPVGDRPALAHVVDRLRQAEAARIVVNAHHRAADVVRFAASAGGDLHVSEEVDLLGTAGGVRHAGPALGDGDVLVWNGDIIADVDPRALCEAHATRAQDGIVATLVVRPLARGKGGVGLDGAGRVVRLRNRSFADEASGGEFLGIHVLGESLRARLPERGCLVGDVYIPALERGLRLTALLHDGPFFDIGSVESYLDANLAWLRARRLERWMGPRARIAPGAILHETVVGEGASVSGDGSLERCVVWPGAEATGPLADAVVAPGLVVTCGRTTTRP
jgi:mannose-1-phosphate guanylyltransferase